MTAIGSHLWEVIQRSSGIWLLADSANWIRLPELDQELLAELETLVGQEQVGEDSSVNRGFPCHNSES